MTEDGATWATGLELPPEPVAEFAGLTVAMGSSPTGLPALMIQRVIEMNRDMRPSGFMWPAALLFPRSAKACRAVVIGCQVRWHGELDDVLHRPRGRAAHGVTRRCRTAMPSCSIREPRTMPRRARSSSSRCPPRSTVRGTGTSLAGRCEASAGQLCLIPGALAAAS